MRTIEEYKAERTEAIINNPSTEWLTVKEMKSTYKASNGKSMKKVSYGFEIEAPTRACICEGRFYWELKGFLHSGSLDKDWARYYAK